MPITSLLAVFVALQQGASSRPSDDPTRVVWLATRAVEGDSGTTVSARWANRLRRDPGDRAAELGLATLARLTYHYDDAERRYARLLPPAGQVPDRYGAHARLGQGLALRTRGLLAAAEPWLAAAVEDARAAGDPAAEAEAILYLSGARIRTRGTAAAESLVAQAARIAPSDDQRLQALLRCTQAGLLASVARPEASREAEAGAELARRAGEPRLHAACRHVVAQDLLRRGNISAAYVVWNENEIEQRGAQDGAGLAVTLQWRGYSGTTVGAYASALADYRAAAAEAEASGNQSAGAFALSGLARISNQTGDAPAGRQYAERARILFEAQGDRYGVMSMLESQSWLALSAGRLVDAEALHDNALAMAERDMRADWIMPMRSGSASFAIAAGDADRAGRLIDSAASFARTHGMPGWEAGLANSRGLVALLRNDLESAARFFGDDLRGAANPFRIFRARARLAEVRARQGDAAGAERELLAATDTLESWRGQLSDGSLRLHVFQLQEDWVDPDMGIATILSRMATAGRVAPAFHLAERRRARELLDRMVQGEALRAPGPDSARSARRSIASALTLAEVATALPDERTAILEYVTGRGAEPTTVFVVTRSGGTAHQLPQIDSLSSAVERFVALVEAGGPTAALARSLGGALLDPVLSSLPGTVDHLVIVPDDVLHRVPFDLLATADGRPVVEKYVTSIVPSATVAAQLWKRSPAPGGPSLLAFADPVFLAAVPATDSGAGVERADGGTLGLPRLPGSRAEAVAAARHVPRAEVRLRERASEAFLKTAPLEGYRIVHFATHAVVDERSVARTVLALAPGEGEDGLVGPGDLAVLRLDADLAVLSACRTAGGVVVRGEGIQGLTAPLLQAGARSVLATQWRVPDRATSRFIADFYDKAATGLAVSDALRQTKLEAIRRGAPASEWAAFVLVGDPFVRVFGR